MPAVRRNAWTRAFWRIHRAIFRATGGRVGNRVAGHDVLFLTTTGRRSGEPRTVGLYHLEVDRGHAVIGSYAGEDRDPAWVLNLRSEPAAAVQIGTVTWRVRAREAMGSERTGLLHRFEEKDDAYRRYQERTQREIPIFVLEPVAGGRPET